MFNVYKFANTQTDTGREEYYVRNDNVRRINLNNIIYLNHILLCV